MANTYYVDAAIWMDLFEDRKGYNNEPLGEFAHIFLSLVKIRDEKIIVTDFLIEELRRGYSLQELEKYFAPFKDLIIKAIVKKEEYDEAEKISMERDLPMGDALHAIVSRNLCLILITRDKHFKLLKDIAEHYKPEDVI
ncbi:MAG: PIN domain-containing protein [Candidatus Woesearchaeota archaeon]